MMSDEVTIQGHIIDFCNVGGRLGDGGDLRYCMYAYFTYLCKYNIVLYSTEYPYTRVTQKMAHQKCYLNLRPKISLKIFRAARNFQMVKLEHNVQFVN